MHYKLRGQHAYQHNSNYCLLKKQVSSRERNKDKINLYLITYMLLKNIEGNFRINIIFILNLCCLNLNFFKNEGKK